ncbi:MAG: transcription elongation factor GreA, partial [Gammaproteobacteria bacterium]|nr:transcription elongation factor GreA [Gammaproteobacteria bacterium]
MNQIPLTAAGAERLKLELKELKSVKRPAVIEAIATARDHGDLKENAEYHAAREEQGFIEGRIAELESALSNAQIIDVTQLNVSDRVVFGCTVELLDVATD